MSEEEVLAMETAVEGFPVYLTGVAPGLEVQHFFRQWTGDFTVESKGESGEGETDMVPRYTPVRAETDSTFGARS